MISFLALRLGLPVVLGLITSAIVFGSILVGSDGTEPRGICEFVGGDAGLLPLDPNKGGTYSYSCNLNIPLAAFYIFVIGAGLSVLFYFSFRLFLVVIYPFAGRRISRNEIEFSSADEPGHE